MAERALLVRETADGQWAVSRSRWGGASRSIATVCAGHRPTDLSVSWTRAREVPCFPALVESLDYLSTAALYRVRGADDDVTVFLPLWFGLPLPSTLASPAIGALVAVKSLPALRSFQRSFRRLKGRLANALVAGYVTPPAAVATLVAAVAELRDHERYLAAAPDETFSARAGPDCP